MGLLSTGLDFMTGGALTGKDFSDVSMSDVLTDEAKRRLKEQLENAGNQAPGVNTGAVPGGPVAPASIAAYQQPQPTVNGMPMLGGAPLAQAPSMAPQYTQATNLAQPQQTTYEPAQAANVVQQQPLAPVVVPVPVDRTATPEATDERLMNRQASTVAANQPVAPVAPQAAPVQQAPQAQPAPQTVASLAPLSVQPPAGPVAPQPGAEAIAQQLATNLSANANAAGAPVKPLTYGRGNGSAASVNNPSGLGAQKDANGQYVWRSYDTPAEGVADTQALVNRYLQTPGRNTPEGFVGTWVTGDARQGASVQGGAYAASVRKELAAAGVELNPDGTIPNTKAANDAITRAVITHESGAKNAEPFLPHVGQALIPSGQRASAGTTLAQGAPTNDAGSVGVPTVTPTPEQKEYKTLMDILHSKQSLTPKEQQAKLTEFIKGSEHSGNRRIALDSLLEYRQNQKDIIAAKEEIASGKVDYTRELKRNNEEGSWVKYLLANRLGLKAMAADEASKLGYGHTTQAIVDEKGNRYTGRYNAQGDLIKAYDQSGRLVPDKTLSSLAANGAPMKGAEVGSSAFRDPKTGEIYYQTKLKNGQWSYRDQSGRQAPNASTLRPYGIGSDIETKNTIAFNQARIQILAAGPKAGNAYIGEFNRQHGTNYTFDDFAAPSGMPMAPQVQPAPTTAAPVQTPAPAAAPAVVAPVAPVQAAPTAAPVVAPVAPAVVAPPQAAPVVAPVAPAQAAPTITEIPTMNEGDFMAADQAATRAAAGLPPVTPASARTTAPVGPRTPAQILQDEETAKREEAAAIARREAIAKEAREVAIRKEQEQRDLLIAQQKEREKLALITQDKFSTEVTEGRKTARSGIATTDRVIANINKHGELWGKLSSNPGWQTYINAQPENRQEALKTLYNNLKLGDKERGIADQIVNDYKSLEVGAVTSSGLTASQTNSEKEGARIVGQIGSMENKPEAAKATLIWRRAQHEYALAKAEAWKDALKKNPNITPLEFSDQFDVDGGVGDTIYSTANKKMEAIMNKGGPATSSPNDMVIINNQNGWSGTVRSNP